MIGGQRTPPVRVAGAVRTGASTIEVRLTNGRTTTVTVPSAGAWRLTDPGTRLDDPRLRMDGSVLPIA